MISYGPLLVEEMLMEHLGIPPPVGNGPWRKLSCPFHEDRHPSFGLNVETGQWICRSNVCGRGDLADLVAKVTGRPVTEIRRLLLSRLASQTDSLEWALRRPAQSTAPVEVDPLFYDRARIPKYLLNRGFTVETLRTWGAGWDTEFEAAVLPAHDADGVLRGLVYRTLSGKPEKYLYTKGWKSADFLFGIAHVPTSANEAILVEGPLDAVWLYQNGWPGVAILGSHLSEVQADQILRRFWSVVLAFDADTAGKRVTEQAYRRLSPSITVSIATLPLGRKDVQECSPEELNETLMSAS